MEEEVFIYIDDWKYKSESEQNRFYGHPIQGKVYRARKENDKYKIDLPSIDETIGVILVKEGEENSLEYCDYKFTEINDDNLVNLDISIDDLDLILKSWSPKSPKEKLIEQDNNIIPDDELIQIDDVDMDLRETVVNIQAFNEISDNLNTIFEKDKNMFNIIRSLVRVLSEDYKTEKKEMTMIRSIIEQIKLIK
jgi:hypothetical protein